MMALVFLYDVCIWDVLYLRLRKPLKITREARARTRKTAARNIQGSEGRARTSSMRHKGWPEIQTDSYMDLKKLARVAYTPI